MALGPMLTNLLKRSGLEELTAWASKMVIEGASEAEIEISLYDQPEFRRRFPMIFARANAGYGAISVQEVLDYENGAMEMAKSYGMSVSREEISSLIANDVSLQEADSRMGLAAQAVHRSSTEMREQLSRLYGVTAGDLTRYWLNPTKELPVLQRRFIAAGIAEQASRAGFRQELTAGQAEGLARLGVDAGSASEGFGRLVANEELFEAVDDTESDIGVEDQLRLITGDAELVGQVERRAEKRRSPFQGGGGFATGDTGIAGLGSASS